ncbi:MAG: NAD(P)-binding protein, partial [Erysipelotrichaceae bacterium]|nr:NAD(P)-binding protein [Erysipelotrichaceae bacterium]
MTNYYESLFTPFHIGKCEIKNRVVLCAMEGTNIVDWMMPKGFVKECRDYYIDRAQNNVGLMIPGMIPMRSMIGDKWLYKNPKAFKGVKNLMDEIHTYGSKVFFQLGTGFAGRNFTFMPFMETLMDNKALGALAKPIFNMDALMVSASDNLPNVWNPDYKTRALTKDEIDEYIHAYAEVAYLCKQHGVDGVEVHAVHEGYLLDQFTTAYTNNRTDEYGGSLENRLRFATRVVKAIKARCGEDYPVLLRYSVTSKVIDFNVGAIPGEEFEELGRNMEESEKAVKILEAAGYDGLNTDNGTYDSWYWAHPPVYMPQNCNLKEAIHIKQFVNIPVICAGKMQPDAANKAIEEGKLDGFGVARALLADAEYITKLKEGRFDDIRPCIGCHNGCLPTGKYKGSKGVTMETEKGFNSSGDCAVNPYTHHEKKYTLTPAKNPKKIAVIGGGIGGMEVARILALRGHEVDIYEKSNKLGGVFNAAAAPSFKEKDKQL